jgi:hypothetical protein
MHNEDNDERSMKMIAADPIANWCSYFALNFLAAYAVCMAVVGFEKVFITRLSGGLLSPLLWSHLASVLVSVLLARSFVELTRKRSKTLSEFITLISLLGIICCMLCTFPHWIEFCKAPLIGSLAAVLVIRFPAAVNEVFGGLSQRGNEYVSLCLLLLHAVTFYCARAFLNRQASSEYVLKVKEVTNMLLSAAFSAILSVLIVPVLRLLGLTGGMEEEKEESFNVFLIAVSVPFFCISLNGIFRPGFLHFSFSALLCLLSRHFIKGKGSELRKWLVTLGSAVALASVFAALHVSLKARIPASESR